MKVYISGRITGHESKAQKQFAAAERKLKEIGYVPVNPFNLDHNHDKSWESYMKVCIKALMECDAILLLTDWHKSRGACIEYELANELCLGTVYLPAICSLISVRA